MSKGYAAKTEQLDASMKRIKAALAEATRLTQLINQPGASLETYRQQADAWAEFRNATRQAKRLLKRSA